MMTGKIVKTLACALMTGLIGWSAHAVSATIPDVPLIASTSVEPNIHLTLDDSGSMHWEVLPDDVLYVYYIFPRANGIYGAGDYINYTVDTDPTNRWACFLRSPDNNRIYYDPSVRYFPWSREDGSLWPDADPHNAFHNPANTGAGARDLT
ncbi:MAG TPA: pilus assembly protein PilC, partial [Chromatiaceae bacterium]|nr:pilus assembly protein PilC [Chromatiaceae bacterium]